MNRVCFLLERGTPPRLNPILAETFTLLEARGVSVSVRYPEDELVRLDRMTVDADLYLLKSDTEMALSLATALEGLGGRVLNRASACALAKDKVVAAAILHRAGIPTPRSLAASRPGQLALHLLAGPLIFKAHRGYHGVGLATADRAEALPGEDAYPDLAFAQAFLSRARTDLKVLGIGDDVFGVRKPFGPDSYTKFGEPVALTPAVEDIARRCAKAFGLELYGLDLAEGEDGSYVAVVDVNYFPGYRGVPDAARRLADHIARAARS
jgi:ribosomal protein S6--L-glutamate ligase